MEYVVHARGDNRVYTIPNGLYELLTDITREVLRSQPQNLYKFIYNYLDAQIKARAYAQEAVKIVNEIIINGQPMVTYLSQRGLTLEEANEAAKKIQKFWRRVNALKELRERSSLKRRVKKKSVLQDIENRVRTEEILRKNRITCAQADYFVTVIQAAFRGYLTRKSLAKKIQKDESYISWDHEWLWEHLADEESLQLIPSEELGVAKKGFLRYLRRRNIPVDRIRLKAILQGTQEFYEQQSPSRDVSFLEREEWRSRSSLRDHESLDLTLDSSDMISEISKDKMLPKEEYVGEGGEEEYEEKMVPELDEEEASEESIEDEYRKIDDGQEYAGEFIDEKHFTKILEDLEIPGEEHHDYYDYEDIDVDDDDDDNDVDETDYEHVEEEGEVVELPLVEHENNEDEIKLVASDEDLGEIDD